jgi:hypothetical protein
MQFDEDFVFFIPFEFLEPFFNQTHKIICKGNDIFNDVLLFSVSVGILKTYDIFLEKKTLYNCLLINQM